MVQVYYIDVFVVDIKQSYNLQRKRCNTNKNRIEFTAFIYNWNALTYYYNNNGNNNDNINSLNDIIWQFNTNTILYR